MKMIFLLVSLLLCATVTEEVWFSKDPFSWGTTAVAFHLVNDAKSVMVSGDSCTDGEPPSFVSFSKAALLESVDRLLNGNEKADENRLFSLCSISVTCHTIYNSSQHSICIHQRNDQGS